MGQSGTHRLTVHGLALRASGLLPVPQGEWPFPGPPAAWSPGAATLCQRQGNHSGKLLWVHVVLRLTRPTKQVHTRVNPSVHYELGATMTCQCGLTNCKNCPLGGGG